MKEVKVSKYILEGLLKDNILERVTRDIKFIDIQERNNNYISYKAIRNIQLNSEQIVAFQKIKSYIDKNEFSVTLLDGITGSGKTEVYLEAIIYILENTNKQVLMIMPEIILTEAIEKRFRDRLQIYCAIWNSSISKLKKAYIWLKVESNIDRVIIGARSSLFLPFENLGLIIIDEEHDLSYKQEEGVRYHARDMAIMRAKYNNIPIILGSATPSLETIYNCLEKKYNYIELKNRYGKAELPVVQIINMKKENLETGCWISSILLEKTKEFLALGKQVMFFLNRKGYAPLVLCKKCGYRFECKNCSCYLVEYNANMRKLECHYCNYSIVGANIICKNCKDNNNLVSCGPGVDRLFEEVSKYFPDKNIVVFN